MAVRVPTSQALDALLREASGERISLGWLVDRLGERSFGIILLLVALLALMPGVSPVAGILLAVPAFQMIRAHPGPVFPPGIAGRDFEMRRLDAVVRRAIPVLRYLERFIYPRWQTPFEATKRVVGGAVLLLSATLFVPAPLSNVPPAIVVGLIAFAYLEQDGALLTLALIGAVVLLAVVYGAIWQLLSTTGWVGDFCDRQGMPRPIISPMSINTNRIITAAKSAKTLEFISRFQRSVLNCAAANWNELVTA